MVPLMIQFRIDLLIVISRRQKILSSWAKVGFVPFSTPCNCLKNPKVRKELGQHTRDEVLESLQLRYKDVMVDNVEAAGFNPGIFDAVVQSVVHVDRASSAQQQVEELLENGKAFSVSGLWTICDSEIGNAGVTLTAQKRQLALNEEAARLKVVERKAGKHQGTSKSTASVGEVS